MNADYIQKMERVIDLCAIAFDGIYGGDAYETLPIETMTPDRQAACHAAIEAIGKLRDEAREAKAK
jgi:hypothetical protein